MFISPLTWFHKQESGLFTNMCEFIGVDTYLHLKIVLCAVDNLKIMVSLVLWN